ncbi:DUF4363 family protein [Clostridium sp.]|uniref:DUF4363 family protein n=1 Tax=Clostridium sp. TaxID=1506 RepID=UPI0025843525|nr:DUF4363 family protein [Clostridium sp.]MDF2506107.1 hypothetical protein [Clostridium sp.]
MKQKKVTIIIALILAISFISLFLIQYFIFYSSKPTFPEMIEEVVEYSSKNQWDKANETLMKVEKKWNESQFVIAIKYADQDYSLLNIQFARLRGAINTKDVHSAEKEGKACIFIFKNITSISPTP